MQTWQCIHNCGACCHLDPSDRPDLETYLSPQELEQYLSMVGESGWCVNYDAQTRQCSIYKDRPRFCRVQPDTFEQMFDIAPEEFAEFAIDCCCEQIAGVYGSKSPEMQRYQVMVVEQQG